MKERNFIQSLDVPELIHIYIINMDEKSNIVININGGTNMIVPSATSAIQNFYGDRFATVVTPNVNPASQEDELSQEEQELYKYVHNIEQMRFYTKQISGCLAAHDLAEVVGNMLDDGYVEKRLIVKGVFIRAILPFATNLTTGRKVDNVRLQINNMLAGRRKKEKMETMVKKRITD